MHECDGYYPAYGGRRPFPNRRGYYHRKSYPSTRDVSFYGSEALKDVEDNKSQDVMTTGKRRHRMTFGIRNQGNSHNYTDAYLAGVEAAKSVQNVAGDDVLKEFVRGVNSVMQNTE